MNIITWKTEANNTWLERQWSRLINNTTPFLKQCKSLNMIIKI